jgi:sterol desaturase/sphingolipid hydroxylase (fatty acid hydroxylase superfamily)
VQLPAGASQGVLYILSPRNWGIHNSMFNSSEALRACATYSSIGVIPTITAMLFDYVYAPWLLRKGLAVRTSEYYISAPWQGVMWDMFSATMITMVPLVAFGTLVHAGALWPIVSEYGLHPFDLLWATMLMLLVHDAYYYFLHRALHANRWLYKHVHAHHHDPRVMLEARTGLIITCWESILGHCIPYAFTLALNMLLFTRVSDGVHFANIPTLVAPMIVSTQLGMIGHSGMRYSSPLVLVVLNPLFACLLFTGTAHSPTDHQYHHERGRCNLSLYFRHWDDWCGTHVCGKGDKRAGASPLLLLYNLAYYLAVTWTLANPQWVVSVLVSRAGLAALCCAVLMPASTTGWTWFRRLPMWDVVREAYACRVMCCKHSGPFDPELKYVFGYHPHGRLARGLWLVFGLTGRKSPVSGIRCELCLGFHCAVEIHFKLGSIEHWGCSLHGCRSEKCTSHSGSSRCLVTCGMHAACLVWHCLHMMQG